MVRAIDTAGRAVVFAGCTVVISLLGLFLMGVDFVNGMAVGTSVTVAVVMLASITLLPAVLGFAGRDHRPVLGPAAQASRSRASRRCGTGGAGSCSGAPGPRSPAGSLILLVLAMPAAVDAPRVPRLRRQPDERHHPPRLRPRRRRLRSRVQRSADPRRRVPEGRRHRRRSTRWSTRLGATPDVAAVSPASRSPSGDAAVIRVIPTQLTAVGRHDRPRGRRCATT